MYYYLIRVKGLYSYNNNIYNVYKFGKSIKDFEEMRIKGYNGCNKCDKILSKYKTLNDIEKLILDKLKNNNFIIFISDLGKEYFIVNINGADKNIIELFLKSQVNILFNILD